MSTIIALTHAQIGLLLGLAFFVAQLAIFLTIALFASDILPPKKGTQ